MKWRRDKDQKKRQLAICAFDAIRIRLRYKNECYGQSLKRFVINSAEVLTLVSELRASWQQNNEVQHNCESSPLPQAIEERA
jgi:heme oxygenase